MRIEKILETLAVRVESKKVGCKENIELGSGIWWQPNEYSEYIYVFTAAHVVKEKTNIVIKYRDIEGADFTIDIENQNIVCHKDYLPKDNELSLKDVAVIRCKRSNVKNANIAMYNFKKINQLKGTDSMIFRGFPKVLSGELFTVASKPLEAKYENQDKQSKLITYSLGGTSGINTSDRDEEMVGFSGSGIFSNNNGEIEFIGIHTSGVGIDSALATFAGMSSELIFEICEEKEWDEPKFTSEIVGCLKKSVKNFMEEIDNQELLVIMSNLIENDFTEVIKCDFCGNSKDCEKMDVPHQCEAFRNSLLIIMCILKYMNDSVNFQNPYIVKGGDAISVRYVCCDGEGGINRVAMKHFIHSIKTDYLMRKKIEEGSLIIWGSKNQIKGNRCCDANDFKNIISDIKSDLGRDSGFDIIKGLTHPKKLSIININELIDLIEEDNLEKMVELIMESI